MPISLMNLTQNILLVDPRVNDYQALLTGVNPEFTVVLLNLEESGSVQIAQGVADQVALHAASERSIAIHILCHGAPGSLQLGKGELGLSTLEQNAAAIARWFAGHTAATAPELFLYGCNVAAGDAGEQFIATLQGLTGATIAASTTPIGNAAKGGNWELDFVAQSVEARIPFSQEARAAYAGVLAPPTIIGTDVTYLVAEDSSGALSGIEIEDSDGDAQSVTLQVTQGTLALASTSGLVVSGDGTGNVTLSGALADVNAALAGLVYTPVLDYDGPDAIAITTNDGNGDVTSTISLSVTPVNDPPVASATTQAAVDEGGNVSFAATDFGISDVDNDDIQVIVKLNSLPSNGILKFNGSSVVAGSTFSLDQIANLKYFHNGTQITTPGSTADTFSITAEDGAGGVLNSTLINIIGNPINQLPIPTNTNVLFEGQEDFPVDLAITDPDQTAASYGIEILTLPTDGILKLNGVEIQLASLPVTLTTADLANLTYSHDGNDQFDGFPPDDSFDIKVIDDGGGTGVPGEITTTIDLQITPNNDHPTLDTNTGIVYDVGTNPNGREIAITPDELSVSDVDSPTTQLSYTITEAPDNTLGSLQVFNGSVWEAIGVGGTFNQEDLIGNRVKYVFHGPGPGTFNDDFKFEVRDGEFQEYPTVKEGGVYDAPTDTVLAVTTFDIEVTVGNGPGSPAPPIVPNAPPTITSGALIPLDESGSGVITTAMLEATDGDNSPDELVYTVGAAPTSGTILVNGNAIGRYGSFTQDDINNGRVSFQHAGGEDFIDEFKFTVTDGSNTTAEQTFILNSTPVNDRPELSVSVPGTPFLVEEGSIFITDSAFSFSDVDGTGELSGTSTFSDVDDPQLTFSVVNLPAHGILEVDLGSGFVVVTPTTEITLAELTGNKFRYTHDGSENFSDSFNVQVNDHSDDEGATNNLSTIQTVNIDIASLNDDPIFASQTNLTVGEGGVGVINGTNDTSGPHLSYSDTDNSTVQRQYFITTATANGGVLLNGQPLAAGSSFSQADLDSGAISYVHDGSENYTDSFDFEVRDGGGNSIAGSYDITITPANDAPELTVPTGAVVFDSDSPLSFGAGAIAIADPDLVGPLDLGETDVIQVTLDLQNAGGATYAASTLAVSTHPNVTITGANGSAGGTLILEGPIADVQSVIDSLTVQMPGDEDATFNLEVTVNDNISGIADGANGGADPDPLPSGYSYTVTKSIEIQASNENDAPVIAPIAAQSINEDTTLTFGAGLVSITDVDAFDSTSNSVTLDVTNGSLNVTNIPGLTIGGNGSGSITLTGTQSDIQAALDSLTYRGDSQYNGPDDLVITVNDGGNTGLNAGAADPQSATLTVPITVNPVNDTPTLNAPSAVQEIATNSPLIFSDATGNAITLDDIRDLPNNGLDTFEITLSTTDLGGATGTLTAASGSGATITNDGSPSIVIGGTKAQIEAALNGLSFTPSNFNSDNTIDLAIALTDLANGGTALPNGVGGARTASDNVTINVSGVNDAPVLTVPSAQTVFEDTASTFSGIFVADPDDFGGDLTVTVAVENGSLTFGTTTGLTFDSGTNGDSAITLTGTEAEINAALATLSYQGDPDFNNDGTDSLTPGSNISDQLTVTINDNGNLGTGGAQTDSQVIDINVTPAADIVDDSETTPEDTPVDIDVLDNDTFESTSTVTDTTNGANGTVTINPDGTVKYTPDPDFNGTDTFTYEVTTAEGDTETATVTVTVTPVTDTVPDTPSTNEDTPVTVDVLDNDTFASGSTVTDTTDGTNGTVAINPDGTVEYTPNPDFHGTDTFTYEVTTAEGDTETETVTVTVNPVADIVDDSETTNEDTPVDIDVLVNDNFESTSTVTDTTDGANGTVTINPDGTVKYTPNPDFNGTDTFTYEVTTAAGNTETATVTVTVTPEIDIVDDSDTTNEDTPVDIDVLDNDGFEDGSATVTDTTDGTNGTVTINPDGTVKYTPDADFYGTDTFTYEVTTIGGITETATVNVTVNPIADIVDDSETTPEDTPVDIDVLNNDTFESPSTVTDTTDGANGTVTINPDGTVKYTPDADFNGTDSFTYEVTTAEGDTETATVTVTVAPVTDTVPDAPVTNEDTPVTVDVLDNDTFASGSTVTDTTDGTNGTVAINPDGTVEYTPNPDFNGTDTFTYEVTTAEGDTETETVTVTVNPVADIVDDSETTNEDTPVDIDVLVNDNFESTSTVTDTTDGANGTVTINPDGTVKYTPNPDFNGTDTFTYEVTTAAGNTETATVTVTVTPEIDIVDDSDTTNEDTPVDIDVLDNDGFEDGSATVTDATNGANGTVTINPDGTVKYTPDADFHGTDTFTYEVTTIGGITETATVNVTVTPVADIVDDSETTPEDTPVDIDVLDNDTFESTSTVTDTTNGANGTVTINPDGTVKYTPDPDFNGTDTFTYEVTTAEGDTETATVTVTVTPVTDTVPDTPSTNEDTPVTVDVLDNDTFASGSTVTDTTDGTNGTVAINPDGTVEYTPNPDFNGTDTFTYEVTTAEGDTETETVTVTVNPVADIVDDSETTNENIPVDIDVLDNDNFESTSTVTDTTDGANGTVTINPDGTVKYTPNPDFNGTDTFTYEVTTAAGNTETATVTVTVNSVGDIVRDSETTPEDTPVVVDVLANDSFSPGASVTDKTDGANGSVLINPDGTVTYTPNPDFNGTDTFTYTVTTVAGDEETTTVDITVAPVVDVVEDAATTTEDVPVDIDVLTNDSFAPGAAVTEVTDGSNGTVTINPDGTVQYQPNLDFFGTDTFTYTVTTAAGDTETETVTVTVDQDTDGDGIINEDDLDDDNDGILDTVEEATAPPNGDTDGDGIVDTLDLDSDNDGINDLIEAQHGGPDVDGDGTVDGLVGSNGVPDAVESSIDSGVVPDPVDSDSDGQPDFQDLDSDNDGLSDLSEGGSAGLDADDNGVLDGDDSDGDGIIDSVDGTPGFGDSGSPATPNEDGDSLPDYLDVDSDDDGIFDVVEGGNGGFDSDGDGAIDDPTDVDNDGILDVVDDSDGDGVPDISDPTSPVFGGTGIEDADGDGIPNDQDLDDDNDGILDTVEDNGVPNRDTDGDGIPDRLDLDADNDGINDVIEAGHGQVDTDGDGMLDGPVGTDGIPDEVQDDPNGGTANYAPVNSDSDGQPDFQDLDSDNDGLSDLLEGGALDKGGIDANDDGVLDGPDSDGDGIQDSADGNPTSYGDGNSPALPNEDGDPLPDYLDIDSDNDGENDVDPALDLNGDGEIDDVTDNDNDGIVDVIDDSDGDGIFDADPAETDPQTFGGLPATDTDGDGVPDSRDLDDDNDGILDTAEGDGSLDTDGDGIPDSRDLDADNDGILDVEEAGHGAADVDGDGRVDGPAGDNGLPDVVETIPESGTPAVPPVDTDNDGVEDFQDLDSDNDGINDVIEGGGSDPDGDGIIGNGQPIVDVDEDGIADLVDPSEGGTPVPVPDSDGDGIADYRELDADNDGIPDVTEGGNASLDGNGDGIVDGSDSDGDGIVDATDDPSVGFGTQGAITPPDTNGDGIPDYQQPGSGNPTGATGTGGSDILTGGTGDDILNGLSDDDVLDGGGGNDIVNGGSDVDVALGGTGNDVVNAGSGVDDVDTGEGDDVSNGGSGDDVIDALGGNDVVNGGSGNDTLMGGDGDDLLNGGSGNDLLQGGRGADLLRGSEGDDRLEGGAGADTLFGGQGSDVFAYADASEFGDTIMDFEIIRDRIDLSAVFGGNATFGSDIQLQQAGQNTIVLANLEGSLQPVATLLNVNANTLDANNFTTGTAQKSSEAVSPGLLSRGAGTDFTGDTRPDLLWQNNVEGTTVIWAMNDSQILAGIEVAAPSLDWKATAIADFNNDGKSDIFWRNQNSGANVIWNMDGNAIIGSAGLPSLGLEWELATTGDFNNDTHEDIVWRHRSSGSNIIWYLNDGQPIAAQEIQQLSTDWSLSASGDFNGDGNEDLIWRNQTNGSNVIWYADGNANLIGGEAFASLPDLDWQITGSADMNSDGRADLLWRNQSNGSNVIWHMNGISIVDGLEFSVLAGEQWQMVA